MFIYVKTDTRGVVKDYEHTEVDLDSTIKQWSMKFYDDKTNNPDLEEQGYVKTYLIESFYQTFETYYDLFTLVNGQLMLPTNIPSPSNQMIQTQLQNQDANNRSIIAQNNDLKGQLSQLLASLKGES